MGLVRIPHTKLIVTCYAELVFLNPGESAGHVVHSSVSGVQNINTLYFMLRWARCSFHKKRAETYCTKLVFLHLVGSADHVMHFGVFGA
jgi:hypothetical protein